MSKWEVVKLGDMFKISSGGTPSKSKSEYYENGTIQWVRTGDLKEKYITQVDSLITEDAIRNSSAKLFPINTVLVAMYGATIGACSILSIEAATNQACAAFLPNEEVDSSYLYYFLCSKKNDFIKLGVGGAQPNISATILKNIYFPLPPLETQKQIAKTLDSAAELLDMRKQLLTELGTLIKATFFDIFGAPDTNEMGWTISTFKDVAVIDTQMTKDFVKYANYPHIGIDSIEKETGAIVNYKLVKDSDIISGKYLFSDKHIIYSKIRPNLNKVALPYFEGLCSADAYPILPKEGLLNKAYLAYILRSKFFLSYIMDFSNRTNIPKVNKNQLEGFQFPVPPLQLQTQFANIVTKIEEQKAIVKQAIDETQHLFDSLMSEYFE
ncbi:restriction endonuclease subunit S [Paenibacillus tepidiphilus]|uniref:restriction endonuclease subunit S n=1 Tax=Paenibacillus tepidiphilus TaxID=2608683 RepID=UPI00123C468D|nr:restriction endonuclease subunit S [Paenibacillus tepidiphilus]